MKNSILPALFFLLMPTFAGAAGMTQHQFMADIGFGLVSTPELSECMGENRDAFLVGAPFPDAGYAVLNDPMSDDAHSSEFVDAFVTHIRDNYSPPYTEKYRLISFLMGVASHVADDPPYHAYFISRVADEDFEGDYDLAHTMCDTGIEFLTIMDHDRWKDIPEFWLPLRAIKDVYALMGSHYSTAEIVTGNVIILVADYAERLITPLLYLPMRLTMPWAASNYYYYPEGGLLDCGWTVAEYYEDVWDALLNPSTGSSLKPESPELSKPFLRLMHLSEQDRFILYAFARKCLDESVVEVEVTQLDDGSVILGKPRITDTERFKESITEVVEELGW